MHAQLFKDGGKTGQIFICSKKNVNLTYESHYTFTSNITQYDKIRRSSYNEYFSIVYL